MPPRKMKRYFTLKKRGKENKKRREKKTEGGAQNVSLRCPSEDDGQRKAS
jgi:hypothetical protein